MKTYGLIGYPVTHSLSGLMHNAAFKGLTIEAHYRLFEVAPEDLENFLISGKKIKDKEGNVFSMEDLSGFNITIPHKVRAYEILRNYHYKNITVGEYPYVCLSGAINTVKRQENKGIEFENTDAPGFMKSLEKDLGFDFKDKNIFVFGCGGAGRAVIAGLSAGLAGLKKDDERVKKIYIYDTHQESLESAQTHFNNFKDLKDKLEFIYSQSQIADKIKNCQLLVNASPVGMKEGDASTINKDLLHQDLSVYDVVYNWETQLIKDAKSRGLNNSGGGGMLLYQGVAAFELWTGENAPVEVMRGALEEGLRECRKK